MSWTNYHSHCHYCDGTDPMEAYLHEAIRQKVRSYGFSSHAPLTFPTSWAMPYEKVAQYLEEAHHLKQKFSDLLEVYLGMEVDFIPEVAGPQSTFIKSLKLDYVIGSIHFVDTFEDGTHWEIDGKTSVFKKGIKQIFKGNIKKAIKRYYALTRQMLEEQRPDVLGHLDKIKIHNRKDSFFDEKEEWYKKEISKTLKVLARSGAILEVNTRGLYKKKTSTPYPSPQILKEAFDLKIPITLSSDAHHPEEVALQFQDTAKMLYDIGFREVQILTQGTWQSRPFDKKGIQLSTNLP